MSSLGKAANDVKRQICKICKQTGLRWDAKNIKGKLLIVHSMNDGMNSIENTNRLIEELVEAGVQFEMQLYPNKDESFTASLLQPHLYNRIVNFLKNNIK